MKNNSAISLIALCRCEVKILATLFLFWVSWHFFNAIIIKNYNFIVIFFIFIRLINKTDYFCQTLSKLLRSSVKKMNADIFKKIFLPYHKKLYGIAYRMVENQPDAEDIVQETYIKLWQKRNDTEQIENMESFAVAVLKNTCLDFLRKMKPETVELSVLSQKIGFLETQIEDREKLQYVEAIVKQLPERQQQLIRLKHYKELSDKEIEKLTGLKTGNIKVIISRARKTIKEQILKLYEHGI